MLQIDDFFNVNPYSRATQEQYRRCLLDIGGQHGDLAELSAGDLRQWLDNHPAWGSSMRWMAYSAIRAYLRWKFGADHPALTLKIKRQKSGPQRTVQVNQVIRLIAFFKTANDEIASRDLAIMLLMIDTGLRESEVCRLEVGRVNLTERKLSVLCKGNQWGYGIFGRAAAEAISAWLPIRKSAALPGVKSLFISLGGLTPGQALTPSGLRSIVRRRWGEALGEPISPHDFRRGFATIATKAKAPTRLVQIAGRWQHIDMVEHYTRDLEIEDFRGYSPGDYVIGLES